MSEQSINEPILTDHSYDGIQEYDNPLPGWWKFLFWGSILIAPLYLVYYHLGEGRSIHDEYERQMAGIFELRFQDMGVLELDRATILKYMDDPDGRNFGKMVYKMNCVSCHGANGEGLVGPNLTDDYWKNVKHVEDIATVIQNGAANGSMPAWKNRLSHQNQIVLTAAYVAWLRNNPIEDIRKPYGTKIPGWDQ